MKKCFYLIFFLMVGLSSKAQLSNADQLFEEGKYAEAIQLYEDAIASNSVSANTYYNLGNAYFRKGKIGLAIWGYESALKLDPDHEDALYNLEYVNAQTVDKIDVSRQGIGHWFAGILFNEHINFWAYGSLILALSFILVTYIYISRKWLKRSISGILTAFTFILFLFSLSLGIYRHHDLTSKDRGVVIVEQVDVKLSPMGDAKTTYVLGEGAQVDILKSDKMTANNGWMQIAVNGNQGWIEVGTIKEY